MPESAEEDAHETPLTNGDTTLECLAGLLNSEIDQQIKKACVEIEIERHEVASDDLLCLQQQFAHADDRQKSRCLHELCAGVDPGRQDRAKRLRQEHIGQDLRERQADAARGLSLTHWNRLERTSNDLADMRPAEQGKGQEPSLKGAELKADDRGDVEGGEDEHEHWSTTHHIYIGTAYESNDQWPVDEKNANQQAQSCSD